MQNLETVSLQRQIYTEKVTRHWSSRGKLESREYMLSTQACKAEASLPLGEASNRGHSHCPSASGPALRHSHQGLSVKQGPQGPKDVNQSLEFHSIPQVGSPCLLLWFLQKVLTLKHARMFCRGSPPCSHTPYAFGEVTWLSTVPQCLESRPGPGLTVWRVLLGSEGKQR